MDYLKKTAGTAVMIMLITFLSKVLGFIRETVIAAYYGSGWHTDAYFAAQTCSLFLVGIIGTGLSTILIPVYTEHMTKKGSDHANRFASNVANIFFVLFTMLTVASIVLAPYILRFFAPGFNDITLGVSIKLARIMFPVLIFNILSSIATAVLQARKRFIAPACVGIPLNVIIIICIILFSKSIGIYALAWASLVASLVQVIIQLPSLNKVFKHRFIFHIYDKSLHKLILIMFPIIIGNSIHQINTMIDQVLASSLEGGSVSAINYSEILIGFATGIFIMSISTVLYPSFSEMSAKGEHRSLSSMIENGIILMFVVMVPVAAIMMMMGKDIVQLVFERGAFDADATFLTAVAFRYYAPSVAVYGAREILNRAFYSLKYTKLPVICGASSVGVNIVLNIILVKYMGVAGLGLATSISVFINMVLLMYFLKGKLSYLNVGYILIETCKILLALVVMCITACLFRYYIPPVNFYLRFIVSLLVCIASYLSILVLTKFQQFNFLKNKR
ncbi:MAG: murein biosynthesis integral membrane protein MurJ [Clostridia bacterium]|nr:murein biosynthesis integral membrane protein MurJ [Clostridia bacterium]